MRDSEPLPEQLRSSAFGPASARAAGVGENRLRRRDLARPFHGVRVSDPPADVIALCRAYAPRLPAGQFFSHTTAAALHGLPLPERFPEPGEVHVGAILPADAPHARNVHGHRLLETLPPVAVAGLPVVHQLDALVQLGSMLDTEDLTIVVDELMNRTGLTEESARDLMCARVAAVRRVGAPKLVRSIRAGRRGSRSPAETRIRLILAAGKIPDPELNAPIHAADGRYLGSPDFVWREQKVVLEYEGDGHRVDRQQFRYDIARYDAFAAEGWRVIRVTGDDLTAEGRRALVVRVRRALSNL